MSKSSTHDDSSNIGYEDDGNISSEGLPNKPNNPNRKKAKWNVGDRVLVKYGDTRFYYEGKVIFVTHYDDQPSYKITYPGWGRSSDEDIVHDEAVNRFMEYTVENRRKAKEDINQASASQSKKRKARTSAVSNGSLIDSNCSGSNKKPKNSRVENASVTDTPLAAFKSSSHKVRPKIEKKLPSLKLEKKKPKIRAEKKQSLLKSEKKSPLPEVEKKPPSPNVDRELKLPETIPLSDKLNKIFLEDRFFVLDDDMLPKLPAVFPIKKIMEQYVDSLEESLLKEAQHFSQVVLDRFKPHNVMLIVYPFEVAMVKDLLVGRSGFGGLRTKEFEEQDIATGVPKDLTVLLGVAYVLRFLVNFHRTVVEDSSWTQKDLKVFVSGSTKFVEFLDNHADEYFQDDDYYPASVMYCMREESGS